MRFHRKIRLPVNAYKDNAFPCAITICTYERKRIFENNEFSYYCIEFLKRLCSDKGFRVYAYCFMPDHVHLLIQGGKTSSILDLIREFKSISTRESRKYGFSGKIYQTSFYDHFLRKYDDVETQVKYILENPGYVN